MTEIAVVVLAVLATIALWYFLAGGRKEAPKQPAAEPGGERREKAIDAVQKQLSDLKARLADNPENAENGQDEAARLAETLRKMMKQR